MSHRFLHKTEQVHRRLRPKSSMRDFIRSEPDPGQKINSAFVKKLSGNDPLTARLLFSNDIITYRPSFKILLLCNGIPVMTHNDPAVWKRMRIIDFPTTFVDNPVQPNERKIDRTLKTKITEDVNYRKEFMLMLLDWYKTLYLVKGLADPPNSVLRATRSLCELASIGESVLQSFHQPRILNSVTHTHLCHAYSPLFAVHFC